MSSALVTHPADIVPADPSDHLRPIDIDALRAQMDALGQDSQIECPFQHELVDGMYLRRTSIPAGTLVVGRKHKRPSLNLLLAGTVVLIMPNGITVALTAPECFFSPAGEQKLAYTTSDIICANVFHVQATTVEAAESEVFEP